MAALPEHVLDDAHGRRLVRAAPPEVLLAELRALRGWQERQASRTRRLTRWHAWALDLFHVAGAAFLAGLGLGMFGPVATRPLATALVVIAVALALLKPLACWLLERLRRRAADAELDPTRLRPLEPLLTLLAADVRPDAPLELELDLLAADAPRKRTTSPGVDVYTDPYLRLRARLADGTRLRLAVDHRWRVTLRERRSKATGHFKGFKKKHKVARRIRIELHVSPERYPDLGALSGSAAGAVSLPKGVELRALDARDGALLLDARSRHGGGTWRPKSAFDDTAPAVAAALLSLYQVLGFARAKVKGKLEPGATLPPAPPPEGADAEPTLPPPAKRRPPAWSEDELARLAAWEANPKETDAEALLELTRAHFQRAHEVGAPELGEQDAPLHQALTVLGRDELPNPERTAPLLTRIATRAVDRELGKYAWSRALGVASRLEDPVKAERVRLALADCERLNPVFRCMAAEQAGARGVSRIARLAPQIVTPGIDALKYAVRTLRAVLRHPEQPRSGEAFLAIVDRADWSGRRALLTLLEEPTHAPLLPALAELAARSDPSTQLAIVRAAERIGSPAAAPLLERLQARPEPALRAAAGAALTKLRAAPADAQAEAPLTEAVRQAVTAHPQRRPTVSWERLAPPPRPLSASLRLSLLALGWWAQWAWAGLAAVAVLSFKVRHLEDVVGPGALIAIVMLVFLGIGLVQGWGTLRVLRHGVAALAESLKIKNKTKVRLRKGQRHEYASWKVEARFMGEDGAIWTQARVFQHDPSELRGDPREPIVFVPKGPLRFRDELPRLRVRDDGGLTLPAAVLLPRLVLPALALALIAARAAAL